MQHQPHQWIGMAITVAIVAVILMVRLRQARRARPLKLERLWIAPALYGVIAAMIFWRIPPHGLGWLYCLVAFAVGAALGWYRGKLVAISIDPDTHALNQQTSPAAMLFMIAIVLLRIGARAIAVEMQAGDALLLVITDVLIAFALGFLPMQRLEMGLRASRLLRAARGG